VSGRAVRADTEPKASREVLPIEGRLCKREGGNEWEHRSKFEAPFETHHFSAIGYEEEVSQLHDAADHTRLETEEQDCGTSRRWRPENETEARNNYK